MHFFDTKLMKWKFNLVCSKQARIENDKKLQKKVTKKETNALIKEQC
jgi:hypothetical protein